MLIDFFRRLDPIYVFAIGLIEKLMVNFGIAVIKIFLIGQNTEALQLQTVNNMHAFKKVGVFHSKFGG
jgi:hypothetical protein